MSNSVNQIFLLGTAGKDPEIRATGGGTLIATFSIATSEGRKDAQGNWKDETTWHNIKAFGRTAETVRDKLNKGGKVFIEGKLTTESWDDKQTGKKRYKSVIIANYLSVVPTARSSSSQESVLDDGNRLPPSLEKLIESTEVGDDDIPF